MLNKYPQQIKLVVKHFPLKNHRFARHAARAALAANEQGRFWEFHQKLFLNHRVLNEQKIKEIAGEVNLNLRSFEQDRKSSIINQLIDRDIEEGKRMGVRGTPTVFINGKKLKRRSFRDFKQAIAAELKK